MRPWLLPADGRHGLGEQVGQERLGREARSHPRVDVDVDVDVESCDVVVLGCHGRVVLNLERDGGGPGICGAGIRWAVPSGIALSTSNAIRSQPVAGIPSIASESNPAMATVGHSISNAAVCRMSWPRRMGTGQTPNLDPIRRRFRPR